jgi:hypothetical protein
MADIINGSNDAGWCGIYEWYRPPGERERQALVSILRYFPGIRLVSPRTTIINN